jgi:hypothetical protein
MPKSLTLPCVTIRLMPAVLRDGGLRGPGATSPLAGALWWFKGGKDVGSSSNGIKLGKAKGEAIVNSDTYSSTTSDFDSVSGLT